MRRVFLFCLLTSITSVAGADCISHAKRNTKFVILDERTIVLRGNADSDPQFMVKTSAPIKNPQQLSILKNMICSHDSAVLSAGGQVIDVEQVNIANLVGGPRPSNITPSRTPSRK